MKKLLDKILGTKVLSESQFTEKYLNVLSKKYPNVSYKIKEPLVIKAIYGENDEVTHFLDNSYREYKLDLKELDEVIERYTYSTASIYEKDQEININRIVPIIKPNDYFEQLKTLGDSTKDYKVPELVWEKYNEDLIIIYAEDRDDCIHYFNQEEFEQLNIDRNTLLEKSIKNLNNVIPKIEKIGENGDFVLVAGGCYETSLILMQTIWTNENFEVDGDIIIAIPNRDLVFITGSNNKRSIEKLQKTIPENYMNGNHSISTSFYKWQGTKFEKI